MREDPSTRQSPAVLPGQIWVIEHNSDAGLSSMDRDALTSANVVLYDRAFAPLLAEILPLGGYAEPLSLTGATCARRALDLAAQGWSVVQLVAASSGRPVRCHAVAPLRAVPTVARPGLASAFTANGLAG